MRTPDSLSRYSVPLSFPPGWMAHPDCSRCEMCGRAETLHRDQRWVDLFESASLPSSLENDMVGWLRSHEPSKLSYKLLSSSDRADMRGATCSILKPTLSHQNLLMAPKLTDMSTWTGRTGKDGLRSFTAEDGNFWLEQNATKTSKWAKFAGKGHDVAWEFGANRRYTGRMLIDAEILTPSEATKKYLSAESATSAKSSD